jgi:hypothetical protein
MRMVTRSLERTRAGHNALSIREPRAARAAQFGR